MVYQGFFEILMITLISSKKLGVCNNMRYTVCIELIESLFLANFIAFSLVAEMYSYVPNKQGSPNKRAGWANFFVYYKKNNGEGVQIFRLLHEKQPVGSTIFQK